MTISTLEIHLSEADLDAALRADVLAGLTAIPKWLPPKWFYDERGSKLFEAITELPEYYPTRTERALLGRVAGEVAAAASGAEVLVELGSGSSEKTRLLLSALRARGVLHTYVPQDVSPSALQGAADVLAAEFPGLTVRGVVSDFTDTLRNLPGGGKRMIAFLGGTLGNLVPAERAAFLRGVRDVLAPGEYLLLGVGLVIDPAVLVPAYDDAAGVTAEFNRNVLRVLNRELSADFDPEDFEHVALFDEQHEWIEMRLRARREHTVLVRDLDLEVHFDAGEELRTEISAKFTPERVEGDLAAAGLELVRWLTDPDGLFALTLSRPASG
jgi:L-histidine Nalpha-methyltransferase